MLRRFPKIFRAALPVALTLALGSCREPQGDPSVLQEIAKTFEAQGGSVLATLTTPDDIMSYAIFRVHGIEGCKASYDPQLKDFSHQIVFGALFGDDLAEREFLAQDHNISLWSKDLTKELWDGYCWQMVKNRDDYAECPSADNQTFLIGAFTKPYYDEAADYSASYDAALALVTAGYGGKEPAGATCGS